MTRIALSPPIAQLVASLYIPILECLTFTVSMADIVSSGRRRGVGRALAQDHVRDRQEGMGKERLKMALQVLFREQCDEYIRSEYQRL